MDAWKPPGNTFSWPPMYGRWMCYKALRMLSFPRFDVTTTFTLYTNLQEYFMKLWNRTINTNRNSIYFNKRPPISYTRHQISVQMYRALTMVHYIPKC
jgi:hypothetical protein